MSEVVPVVPLAGESNLIPIFQRDVQAAGLVGEEKNASVILLSAVSARLEKPIHMTVTGESSSGKNHLISTVARFIPEEHKKLLTGMSPKVLMHADEHEYEHRAVIIAEYDGVSGADYAIRTMQSERVIEWEYVESSSAGIQKKTKRVNGPVAFIQATTRVTLHPENETRLLFIEIDESAEQTQAINERQAMEAAMGTPALPSDLFENWHKLLHGLDTKGIRIPFAPQLSEHFPADRVRSRRDFPKLLGLIEVSAYLHQHVRPRDPDQNIVAVPQDYFVAKALFEHCYYTGPEKAVGELLEAASQLPKDREFSVAELLQKTGWKKSKTYLVLDRAAELGCVTDGERRGRYRLLRKHTEPPLNLPPRIRLSATDFRISTEGYPPSHTPTLQEAGDSHGKTEKEIVQS